MCNLTQISAIEPLDKGGIDPGPSPLRMAKYAIRDEKIT